MLSVPLHMTATSLSVSVRPTTSVKVQRPRARTFGRFCLQMINHGNKSRGPQRDQDRPKGNKIVHLRKVKVFSFLPLSSYLWVVSKDAGRWERQVRESYAIRQLSVSGRNCDTLWEPKAQTGSFSSTSPPAGVTTHTGYTDLNPASSPHCSPEALSTQAWEPGSVGRVGQGPLVTGLLCIPRAEGGERGRPWPWPLGRHWCLSEGEGGCCPHF